MIQRIQTVYLILTTILPLLFLKGNLLRFTDKAGSFINITFTGIYRDTGNETITLVEKLIPQSALLLLIPLLSLVTIVLYKNRKLQIRAALSVIILSFGLLAVSTWYAVYVINTFNAEIIPGLRMAIPFLIIVFSVLAYTAIRRDERLVRSYDRLR